MKRDILFRGIESDTKIWYYGYFYEECGYTYIIENRQKDSKLNRNTPHIVIPETVGQFTGFLDMNRNKIYESDIIKIPETSVGGIVIFQDGMFCLSSNNVISLFAGWNKSLIIGNIHDK